MADWSWWASASIGVPRRLKPPSPSHDISNIDLIRTYLGLICLGKSVVEAVEPVRTDPFCKSAMGIKQTPASARLRQRFDEVAKALTPLLDDASCDLLRTNGAPVAPLDLGHVALDIGVFPMDNSQARKEGVSYTYKAITAMCRLLVPGSGRLAHGLPTAPLQATCAHAPRENRNCLRQQEQVACADTAGPEGLAPGPSKMEAANGSSASVDTDRALGFTVTLSQPCLSRIDNPAHSTTQYYPQSHPGRAAFV